MDAKKHILILGGDGYLGWTAAMHFSALGYDVTAADNYFRRQVCQAEGIDFLWPGAAPAGAERGMAQAVRRADTRCGSGPCGGGRYARPF